MITGRLILVRHGQTQGNVERRLDTRLPGSPLTETGHAQARELGERLRWEKPVALISSAALRARQTAQDTGLTVEHQVIDGLHEVQAGDFENRNDHLAHDAFHATCTAWHLGDLDRRVPGGESGREVLERFVPVIESLRTRYLDNNAQNTVVVIAHGAAIRFVGAQLADVPAQFAMASILKNTETVELGANDDGSWHCLRWGALLPPFGSASLADDPMG